MKTLKEVACGSTVKVTKLTGDGPVKEGSWTWESQRELIFMSEK